MLTNFITADYARVGSKVAQDKNISGELNKIEQLIHKAIEKGDFSIEWTVPRSMRDQDVNHLLKFLISREYSIWFKNEGKSRLVNKIERAVPSTLKGVFEPQDAEFEINWQQTFSLAKERVAYFDWMNPQKSDLTARIK